MISSIRRFIKRNTVLFVVFLLAVTITLSYYLTYNLPEMIPGIEKWYKLSSDLSIGIIINFIFYVFQVYIPRREEETASLATINPDLNKICDGMQDVILIIQGFVPGYRTGNFNVAKHSIYYMQAESTPVEKGWTRHFDLFTDFVPLKKKISNSTERLFSLPLIQTCEKELIETLGNLQQNDFLHLLEGVSASKFNPEYNYNDFYCKYTSFCSIYEKLAAFVPSHRKKYIRPLTQQEIDFFNARMMLAPKEENTTAYIYIGEGLAR